MSDDLRTYTSADLAKLLRTDRTKWNASVAITRSKSPLGNADLWNADLRNADLGNADLRNANLGNANLWNADLRNANLGNANLGNANLGNANLGNANLGNALVEGKPMTVEQWCDLLDLALIPHASLAWRGLGRVMRPPEQGYWWC